ncbi:hypothetical protein N431DRAFT_467391 [Stipitochalara longipes BDJ]|nr:hypothetical protein N431DRAFT_467391 [Stipitochalara longipes BDJ]
MHELGLKSELRALFLLITRAGISTSNSNTRIRASALLQPGPVFPHDHTMTAKTAAAKRPRGYHPGQSRSTASRSVPGRVVKPKSITAHTRNSPVSLQNKKHLYDENYPQGFDILQFEENERMQKNTDGLQDVEASPDGEDGQVLGGQENASIGTDDASGRMSYETEKGPESLEERLRVISNTEEQDFAGSGGRARIERLEETTEKDITMEVEVRAHVKMEEIYSVQDVAMVRTEDQTLDCAEHSGEPSSTKLKYDDEEKQRLYEENIQLREMLHAVIVRRSVEAELPKSSFFKLAVTARCTVM